jgi:site-specific DNA recombinase
MFGYCRISCKKQNTQGDSLNEQDHLIKDYCKRNNINLINVFTEDIISGSSNVLTRNIFKQMYDKLLNKEANGFHCNEI